MWCLTVSRELHAFQLIRLEVVRGPSVDEGRGLAAAGDELADLRQVAEEVGLQGRRVARWRSGGGRGGGVSCGLGRSVDRLLRGRALLQGEAGALPCREPAVEDGDAVFVFNGWFYSSFFFSFER